MKVRVGIAVLLLTVGGLSGCTLSAGSPSSSAPTGTAAQPAGTHLQSVRAKKARAAKRRLAEVRRHERVAARAARTKVRAAEALAVKHARARESALVARAAQAKKTAEKARAESQAQAQSHACTRTSSGSCIQGGEFCKQSEYGQDGYDADGTRYVCQGDSSHPHWE